MNMHRWGNQRLQRIRPSAAIARRSLMVSLGVALTVTASHSAAPALAADAATADDGAIAQVPVNARILHVNPFLGEDREDGGAESRPLRTIGYAIERAGSITGITVIQLVPGTYTAETGETFPLQLDPGIILRGSESNQGETVSIIGGGTFVTGLMGPQNITIVASDDSEIRGLTITNPNTRGTGVWVGSINPINPLIRNNRFTNNNRDGVFITGAAVPTVERNRFAANGDNGISVTRRAGGMIRNNAFIDTGFGIVVSDSASPTIEGNEIRENIDGVVTTTTSRPVLRNNVIQGNSRDGIVAIGNARPDMGTAEDPGENIIVDNERYAIHNATRSNTLLAVGNQADEDQVQGNVEFVARVIGFPDVQGHWAQTYIEALAAQEIIGGFPDGSYRPNEPVTRAQFAAIINQAFALPSKRSGADFGDVRQDFWGYSAIQSAYQQGFLTGYPGQVFFPAREIPRVEVLVSLASGLDLSAADLGALAEYQDAAEIPDWATGAIAAATQDNLVVNYPTASRLNPSIQATRADVAAFVYQALVQAGRAEPVDSEYLVQYP